MDRLISEFEVAEPSRDMEEIEEIINCDADAETKCKMISNILTAKPHYFEKQEPKTGHWITKIKSDLRGDMWPTNPKCSKCGGEPYYSNTIYDYKFCPYCGARMVEPQERSE